MITEIRRRAFLVGAATMLSLPLTALLGGCGSGGSGGRGGNGGGGGGNPDVAPFTVTPDRAAPGTMVTLTGAMVRPDQTVTVRFGDVLTRVFGFNREGASDGVRVLVPPFLNASGQHVDPAAPVTITVQVEGYAARAANNAFTVLPLPPAPGASAAVATELAAFGSFLGDFTENMVRQLSFSNGTPPPLPSTNEFDPAVAAMAFSRGIQFLIDGGGQSNPYSLTAIMTQQGSLVSGRSVSQDVLDSLIAQGPVIGMLQDLAQSLLGSLNAANPGMVTVTAGRHVSLPRAHPTRDDVAGTFASFSGVNIDWSQSPQVEAVRSVVSMIQFTKLLNSFGLFTGGFEIVTGSLMPWVQSFFIAGGLPDAALYVGLDIALYVEGLVSKLMGAYAATLPSTITDFYVVINGETRHNGGPSVDIPLRYDTPLQIVMKYSSSGGSVLSVYGFIGVLADTITRFFPPFKEFFAENKGLDILKGIAFSVVNAMDYVWSKVEGMDPPPAWAQYKASEDKVWTTKVEAYTWPPLDVNNTRLVNLVPTSTNLLGVKVVGEAYRMVGLAIGDNAGYRAFLSKDSLSPNLPSIAEIAAEKFFVVGTVNVAGGTVHGTVD